MGLRLWLLLLLPLCALMLWALMPVAGTERSREVEDGPAPIGEPQQRELAPRPAVRAVREAESAKAPAPAPAALPAQVPAGDSVRALAEGRFAEKRQALELRNVERFTRAEAAFAAATRGSAQKDADSHEREQRLRAALAADGAGERVRGVECRDPLCKLEVAAPEPLAEPLGRGLHFMREAGVQTASAWSGQGEARVLTVYVVRDGANIDALSAQRAE